MKSSLGSSIFMNNKLTTHKTFQKCFMLLAICVFQLNAFAGCDMCSLYLGLHPNQVKNGITFRYRYSLYESSKPHSHNGMNHSSSNGKELRTFQTIEAWGQINFGRKMQLVIMAPFAMNSVEQNGLVLDSYNQIGDIQSLLRYQIFRSADEKPVLHRVIVGIGLKAPSGKFNESAKDGSLDPHIQTGTGSWDFIYNVGYLMKYKSLGINQEFLYRLNTENNLNYRFANRFSSNTAFYYTLKAKGVSILPSIGYLLEHAKEDVSNNVLQTTTNGVSHYVVPSIDVYYKMFNLSASFQKPFVENLRDSDMSNKYRCIVGLGINF